MTLTEEIVSIGALMENSGNRKTPDTIVAILDELSMFKGESRSKPDTIVAILDELSMFKGGSRSTSESIEELLVDSSGSSTIG